jgi:hypothetical protein
MRDGDAPRGGGLDREVTLTERQLRAVIVDAITVASATILYAPNVEEKSHAAAQRILKRFTDVLGKRRTRK